MIGALCFLANSRIFFVPAEPAPDGAPSASDREGGGEDLGALVAAACVAAVIVVHRRESSRIEAQNLAQWQSFLADDQVMAYRQ